MTIKLHIWYQIKGPIIIFHMKGHAVKLKCVNYKIFWKNMIFAKKKLYFFHAAIVSFFEVQNVTLLTMTF